MSRIGKQPVPVPNGVKVDIKGTHVKVTGPKGSLERDLRPEISCTEEGNQLLFTPKGTSKRVMAFWGMTRSLVSNMVEGVDKGFVKVLIVEGVGYRANLAKSTLTLNVGFSNPVEFQLPEGISAEVDKDNKISLSGIDKELVGLTAAKIRAIRKPEPYKGKGIRYVDERIVRKVGKAGAAK
ncbi:50S ribosomal protein L6 [Desulfogranum marinum]|jgi:large subunit ribosomal protein L6|uniref:50S ribosomal protein L6 n=1 Tax=Desulfogranum marinum TaxID=453220 RepID=UPI0019638BE9|nr:50S ribosomal protein L6 [Desulfogranum marinum]MBM9511189.1 50S ribosomal protein L6 [Desulfogranum marinum]